MDIIATLIDFILHVDAHLEAFVQTYGAWVYALLFLIVFVETPTAVRLERLAAREKGRFGDRIAPGGDMHEIHVAFRAWASEYDNPAFGGRNRARHERWIAEQTVPLTRIDGTSSTEKMAADVMQAVSQTVQRHE